MFKLPYYTLCYLIRWIVTYHNHLMLSWNLSCFHLLREVFALQEQHNMCYQWCLESYTQLVFQEISVWKIIKEIICEGVQGVVITKMLKWTSSLVFFITCVFHHLCFSLISIEFHRTRYRPNKFIWMLSDVKQN